MKTFNGLHSLKMRQRICRVIQGLSDITHENVQGRFGRSRGNETPAANNISTELPAIKLGVKLPKSDSQWESANEYFRAFLPISMINPSNIGDAITKMNETMYNYYKNNFEASKTHQSTLIGKYQTMTKHELRLCLRSLKMNQATCNEVQYVFLVTC